MSILATIFGSGAVIEKGLELIDDVWETDAETRESKTSTKIRLLNAYAPFKIAQRYIAIMFTITYLSCFFMVLVMTLFGLGNPDDVLKVMETFKMSWIMSAIVMFYFGGGLVNSAKGKE